MAAGQVQTGIVVVSYLTTAEVAEHYRTNPNTVRYWRHIGRGPHSVKVGRRVLYSLAAIAEFDRQIAAGHGSDAMIQRPA
jgi:hypothetical protein